MNDHADILDRAADALICYGRTTGVGMDPVDGSMCALGAISYAAGMDPADVMCLQFRDGTPHHTFQQYLQAQGVGNIALGDGTTVTAVWKWNDELHGPEGDDIVIDALRRCAKWVREGRG